MQLGIYPTEKLLPFAMDDHCVCHGRPVFKCGRKQSAPTGINECVFHGRYPPGRSNAPRGPQTLNLLTLLVIDGKLDGKLGASPCTVHLVSCGCIMPLPMLSSLLPCAKTFLFVFAEERLWNKNLPRHLVRKLKGKLGL